MAQPRILITKFSLMMEENVWLCTDTVVCATTVTVSPLLVGPLGSQLCTGPVGCWRCAQPLFLHCRCCSSGNDGSTGWLRGLSAKAPMETALIFSAICLSIAVCCNRIKELGEDAGREHPSGREGCTAWHKNVLVHGKGGVLSDSALI